MHIDGDLSGRELLWDRMTADVVAVKRNIQCADAGVGKLGGEAVRQHDAAVGDPEEKDFSCLGVAFPDGDGEPLNGGVYF